MKIGAGPVEQADDGRVDVPHLVGSSRAKAHLRLRRVHAEAGRRQPFCRTRRYQVEGEAQTLPSRWARTASVPAKQHRSNNRVFSQAPESPITRVALYARVSTLNNQDPEMQLSELRDYANRSRGRPNPSRS
jgi:hypothetical protein